VKIEEWKVEIRSEKGRMRRPRVFHNEPVEKIFRFVERFFVRRGCGKRLFCPHFFQQAKGSRIKALRRFSTIFLPTTIATKNIFLSFFLKENFNRFGGTTYEIQL